MVIKNPGLLRAKMSCKIGREVLEGKHIPPSGIVPLEWAIYHLLHAIEDIAGTMMEQNNDTDQK